MSCILALDQSSHITGYAVFGEGALVDYGKLNLENPNIDIRLVQLRQFLIELIQKYKVDYVIYEDIQQQNNVGNNVQTFKTLSEVYGVVSELLEELQIPHSSVISTQWKSTLGIKGKNRMEQKRNALQFIQDNYGIKPTQDECDAICIGVHYLKNNTNNWAD